MKAVYMTLLEMSLSGSVLIATVLVLRVLLLDRLPKRTFPALWGVAVLRLLLPFSVISAFSVYHVSHRCRLYRVILTHRKLCGARLP